MPEFVNPKQVLQQVGLGPDLTAADFGCGSGGWVMPLAEILEDGLVFAVDIQESALSVLESRARLQGLANIRKVLANVEEQIIQIPALSCDFVLITDLLFQVDEKEEVFKQVNRTLKPKGRALVVEWTMESPLGPKTGKISQEEIRRLARKSGLNFEKEFPAGDYHFALLFSKPA